MTPSPAPLTPPLVDFCPLCRGGEVSPYANDARRDYYGCGGCGLVFVGAHQHLSALEEKKVYDQHRNHPDDVGYRCFLGRLFTPLCAALAAGSHGLDFGCGPGPTLSIMFEECGQRMAIYDPFYANEPAVWQSCYDFITATEVVEHLYHPRRELERLWQHLKPGGILAVMTKQLRDAEAFSGWHYKNDPTHVCFFSRRTFEWLAAHWQARCQFHGSDVVFFYKRSLAAVLD